ncbi:MAG: tetratricopeptide repeat protein [Candidatus Cloacimonetes bacterium]|nr:tetratricopeptide repeat protein [Candidatus Cloacimonadota bacterium]
MKKMLIFAVLAVLLFSACTVNNARPEMDPDAKEFTGTPTKVGILPIKSMDANSRNINKILTVRDFDYVFAVHPKYDLLDMDFVKNEYKYFGYTDVEDLEPEELKEIADDIGANVLVAGSISNTSMGTFAMALKFFSARTNEIRNANFSVTNDKYQRWASLDKNLVTELDNFISTEVEKIYNIGTNYYAAGNFAEAEQQLKLAIGLDPENKEAHYFLGATKYKSKDLPAAEKHLKDALALDPNHLLSLRMLNDIYESQGNIPKRLEVMERIAEINNDEELWLATGNLYAENMNTAKAEASLRKALSLKPDYIHAVTRLAFLLYDNHKFGDAIEYLERAYDEYPENDIISKRLATAYQRSGRMEDAIARYEGLIKSNPSDARAYLNVVSLYRQQAAEAANTELADELNTKAISTMNALKAVDANNPMSYLNLASIYLAQGKNAEAETNASLSIQKDPSLYLPYIILATVNQTKGTNDYNRFVDLEKRGEKAVGKEANRLKAEREAAKASANANFRKAQEQLNAARLRTNDAEALSDISTRISRLTTLIGQTGAY